MEISESTIGVFYASKIMALAPFKVSRNPKGGRLIIRRSLLFTIYSASVISILIFLTYRGLLFDANSKIPVRASFRMKSTTSKVVTAMDVSVVVLATTSGVICGLIGLRSTQELNRRLWEIDEVLATYENTRKDKRRAYVMTILSLVSITILLALDIWTWMRVAYNMRKGNVHTELNIQWYIPFYSLYFILTGLHICFAHSAFSLGRRYRRLNLTLKKSFLGDAQTKYKRKSIAVGVPAVKTIYHPIEPMPAKSMQNITEELTSVGGFGKSNQLMMRLAFLHDSLGKCVQLMSNSYGLAVLFMLVSCLLHLVATAYFLFLELLSSRNIVFSWLQFLWILFHTLRLLLIVEPCHVTAEESKRTFSIVCQIERNVTDPVLAEIMRKFWQQLLADKTSFTAYGLCKVNRQILTSFSGAIATYLVILIQFQNTNG